MFTTLQGNVSVVSTLSSAGESFSSNLRRTGSLSTVLALGMAMLVVLGAERSAFAGTGGQGEGCAQPGR